MDERCPYCRSTGVVGIYSAKTVNAVLEDKPMRCAIRVAVACSCDAADRRFAPIEAEDNKRLERFDPTTHCRLPYLGYVPNTGSADADYVEILRWAESREAVKQGGVR